MNPYFADDSVTLWHGDCLDVLREMPDSSVDAVCTDPPYGLEFMGREWDSFRPSSARLRTRVDGRTNPTDGKSVTTTPEAYVAGYPFQDWCQQWAVECLRVLKPGGHLLAFGGTRTVHRLTCGVEDAGFEIRDGIDWLYGQGFPKSMNVGGGRGTALKPAREPIVVARKPPAGTVAANVLAHGTGALNIDACRTPAGQDYRDKCASVVGLDSNRNGDAYGEWTGVREDSAPPAGRWPSNVVLTHAATPEGVDLCGNECVPGCPVAEVDRQSGSRPSGGSPGGVATNAGMRGNVFLRVRPELPADSGGASRYFPTFRYEAKAASAERPRDGQTAHPTVKPLALMRWLVRLVTPPGGVVLDPFAGSGTTAEACVIEGFRCIAVEREADYLPLIVARLLKPLQPALDIFGEAS